MKKSILVSTLFILIALIFAWCNFHPNLNLESFAKYYGFDYLITFLLLFAYGLLEKKDRRSFIIHIVANILNIFLGYLMGSPVIALFSIFMAYIAYRNLKKWRNEEDVIN